MNVRRFGKTQWIRAARAIETRPGHSGFGHLVLLQTTLVDYRVPVIRALARLQRPLKVLAGTEHFDPSVRSSGRDCSLLRPVQNVFLLGRRVLWQWGASAPAIDAGVLIAEGNPRILSTWFALVVRRFANRPTVLWTHAWSRRGPDSLTNRIRLAMFRIADVMLVYTDREALELGARLKKRPIFVAPNSLYHERQMRVRSTHQRRRLFIYCGRLSPNKKPALLVKAFLMAVDTLPADVDLVMIGDGPQADELRIITAAQPRVRWVGPIFDAGVLEDLYSQAMFSVSPGYVGLSLTQSLGFGVPMIIADGEPHSPEVIAARPGVNSVFFPANDVQALRSALVLAVEHRETWAELAEVICADCRSNFSIEAMLRGFKRAVDCAASGAHRQELNAVDSPYSSIDDSPRAGRP